MTKKVGMQYVKEFSFPAEQGFTGSAGKSPVKGYMRGGAVKATHETANANKPRAPSVKASHGGTVGVTTERGPKSRRPKSTMTKAAQGGSIHDQLYDEGGKMGYMRGGRVKDTSSEFVQKAKPMASMDEGVQPARKGRTQSDVEAGGTKRLKPRLARGGGVHKTHHARPKKRVGTKKLIDSTGRVSEFAVASKQTDRGERQTQREMERAKARSRRSKKGMPKNVKAEGGLMEYAEGGSVSPPSVGHLGGGLAARAARGMREREERTKSTVNEALAGQRRSQQASPRPKARVQDKPAPRADRIYREDKGGVPTFTDVPKVGRRVGKRGAAR
jgi:hypothetical protein